MDVVSETNRRKVWQRVRHPWKALQDAYPRAPGAPAFQRTRQLLALAVIALPLGLYGFWLAAGDQPACSVTTVSSRVGGVTKIVTTRRCQLPGMTYYILVLGLVGILLWPDVKSFSIGVLSLAKPDLAAPAAKIASEAVAGDTLAGAQSAEQVFSQVLGGQH